MERTHRVKRPLAAAAALLGALAALAGCTEGGGAIFATIEQEAPPEVSNLPDTATVTGVLELRAAGATEFLAVARTLFLGLPKTAGDNSSLTWTAVEMRIAGVAAQAACSEAVLVRGATAADDRIFAVLAVTAGGVESRGLYSSAPEETITADSGATPALDWSAVEPSPAFAGVRPEGLLLVNGEVFATIRTSDLLSQYAFYRYDPAANAATLLIPYTPVPVSDGAFYGSEYWFVAGTRIWSGDLSGELALYSDAAVQSSAAAYGGIHASDTSLYLSSAAGRLWVRAGGSWTASAVLTYASDDRPLEFTDFVSAGGSVYVGSRGRGFFALGADGLLTTATLADARMPDRTFSELYGGTILGFVPAANVVFIRTAGTGLWHQVVSGALPKKDWVWD